MHTGLLWFDNSDIPLIEKIQKAMDYYIKKYGKTPNLCMVNPKALDGEKCVIQIGSLVVRPYRPVLPGHIWIGIEEQA